MTFSLVAQDPQSGSFGMVVCSSSPAVASRCIHLRTGVGVVASQNVTNPALGALILDRLQEGLGATEALELALEQESYPEYRQVSVVDAEGGAGHHSGGNSLGTNHHAVGPGAVAAGNLLKSEATVDELLQGFLSSAGASLEERLLVGLEAAMAAGGEAGPVRSAGLKVVDDVPWATTDLRVDDAENPIEELRRLWELWKPQKSDYRTRALNPDQAPSYGVPGDQ